MNCQKFEQRINELLDARAALDGDAALESHARLCDACRSLWSAYRQIARVELWPAEGPDVTVAVLLAVAGDKPAAEIVPLRSGGAAWRRLAFAAAACAAIVLVSFSVWTVIELTKSPAGGGTVVHGGGPDKGGTQPMAGTHTPNIPDLAQTAADSYREFARETGKSLSDVAVLVPSVDETPALPAGQAAENASRLAPNVVEGLKPVTRSTAGTLSLLMRVIPPPTKQPPARRPAATQPKPDQKKG
ncbi:MAG: hypothetical protein HYS13_11340 [Planctomycetia bacterium]|nr:hypothetical protein [Planctomycetia bacterium]